MYPSIHEHRELYRFSLTPLLMLICTIVPTYFQSTHWTNIPRHHKSSSGVLFLLQLRKICVPRQSNLSGICERFFPVTITQSSKFGVEILALLKIESRVEEISLRDHEYSMKFKFTVFCSKDAPSQPFDCHFVAYPNAHIMLLLFASTVAVKIRPFNNSKVLVLMSVVSGDRVQLSTASNVKGTVSSSLPEITSQQWSCIAGKFAAYFLWLGDLSNHAIMPFDMVGRSYKIECF